MHSAQELVTQITALTTLPSVYFRVRELLESPEGTLPEVAQALATDPALTARLLRLVNSPLYGFGGRIDTVSRAVTVLGLQQVHDLVLAASIGSSFAGLRPERMDMARFWRASVLCGLAARQIGRSCGAPGAERLFVIGLLADLGHLVMYQTVPHLAADAQARSDEASGQTLDEAERRIVGCDHAELTAALLEHWRLPRPFVEITAAQIHPRTAGRSAYEAAILHVATHVVRADRAGETSTAATARIDPVIWSLLALEPASFERVREEAELDLAGTVALFFPDLPAQ